MEIKELQKELRKYYSLHTHDKLDGGNYRNSLFDLMDEYAAEHLELSPVQLKASQYEIIADNFKPFIFKNSPFYSEMGVKISEYAGVPNTSTGGWLFRRNEHLFRDINPDEYDRYIAAGKHGIHLVYGPYADFDHHCFPFSNVLENGLAYIYNRAEGELKFCVNGEETQFIECCMCGLLAVKKIAEKFADQAKRLLKEEKRESQRRFLGMIEQTARKVPWQKPDTFYEGLCTIWFLHEVCASIEGIGMSVVGHIDKMLGELYQRDLDAGLLSSDEAYDLLCRFMVSTDCKLDFTKTVGESFNRQEQGDVIILGGCDKEGREICNDITFMVLNAHHELSLIYPKIHCRYTKNSRQEYFDAINRDFVSGRNVIAFLNDESLIPAQVKAGKSLEDAREYVAGGCWEVILEGHEHSAGANCYFNLLRIMDMSIHDHPEIESEMGIICNKIDHVEDFEEVYGIVLKNVIRNIREMCMIIQRNGSIWSQVNPAPLFSACLSDCLKNRKDYTAGGGRYNPHGLPLAGFANFINSLLVICYLCFEDSNCTLAELLQAVRADWKGYENLRAKALSMPFFGDDTQESASLASRVLDDLYKNTRDLKNERGGTFDLGIYNYRDVIDWGKITFATPDGRRTGDFLTQGITPSRLHRNTEITSTINSGATLDLSKCPANSVLTVSLPLNGISKETLGQLERSFAASGLAMLQMNCVDKKQLLEAQKFPEKHQSLVVRLYGYSTRFINLTPEMQDEFISRNYYTN